MIVKIFSSVVDSSRQMLILLPSSLPSDLMTLASFSKFFAKAFALSSTEPFAGAFLAGFFVGIMRICKGIKGCFVYRQ